jgi:hypothetical protein
MGMAVSAAVRTEVQGQRDRTYGCVVALALRRDNKKWPPVGGHFHFSDCLVAYVALARVGHSTGHF